MPDEAKAPIPAPEPASLSGTQEPAAAPQPPVAAAATPAAPEPTPAAPAAPAPAAEAKPDAPVDSPPASLLAVEPEGKPAPTEAKAQDAAPVGPDTKEPPPPEPAPTFQPFTLPEGVTFDNERMGQFTETLGSELAGLAAARAKGDGEAFAKANQDLGQKLVDFHIAEMNRLAERSDRLQRTNWNNMQREWQDRVRSDPQLGGDRLTETISEANSTIKRYGGNADQQRQVREALEMTGAANHPAIIRLLANAAKATVKESAKPMAPGNPVQKQTRADRRYNGSKPPAQA